MVWIIVIAALVLLVRYATKRTAAPSRPASAPRAAPSVKVTMELVQPDPEYWAKERAARRQALHEETERVRSSFAPPANATEAFRGVEAVLRELSAAYGLAAPDFDHLRAGVESAGAPPKVELAIRKRITEAYKRRADPAALIEALALCLLHVRYSLEHLDSKWKIEATIKRLASNLDNETGRRSCLGLLHVLSKAFQRTDPEVVELCNLEKDRLFGSWVRDEEARGQYEAGLAKLPSAASASDKHFIINGLVEYLDRRRGLAPGLRPKLVELCEEDVKLYKRFLVDLEGFGTRKSFAAVVESPDYFCPSLPSFDALWDLYEEEKNVGELTRLQKIAREIKYGDHEIDLEGPEEPQAESGAPPGAARAQADPCPVEVIEVPKSGRAGKAAFLDSAGEPCSREDAAQDHFRQQGFKTLRGEVRFWQAMFGLAFWEEIFSGSDAPGGLNDIPLDLFSGERFYAARKSAIDAKAAAIARSGLRDFVLGQVRRHGASWTRIVYEGARGDFTYRKVLESAEVSEFLSTIDPAVFTKIVHRIATNPNENRAGLPDYMVWKDRLVTFVEVKGIREKVRESQAAWLQWMLAEAIPAKIVRIRGKEVGAG